MHHHEQMAIIFSVPSDVFEVKSFWTRGFLKANMSSASFVGCLSRQCLAEYFDTSLSETRWSSWRRVCLRDADGCLATQKFHLLLLTVVLFRGELIFHILDHVNQIPDLLYILRSILILSFHIHVYLPVGFDVLRQKLFMIFYHSDTCCMPQP